MSYREALNKLEALVGEFNRITGRPLRAYEPSDEPYPPANIGFAYTRCLGEQEGNRIVVSIIINEGGGVTNIYGLSGYVGDVLRALKVKLKDPEWVEREQFKPKVETEEEEDKCECGTPTDAGADGLCGNCSDRAEGGTDA